MLKEPDTKGQILYYSIYIPTVVTFTEIEGGMTAIRDCGEDGASLLNWYEVSV